MPDDPSHREDEDEGSLDETLGDKSGKKRTKTAATKGPWSKEEDDVVIKLVGQYGPKRWSLIASNLPGRESFLLLARPRPRVCVRASCAMCAKRAIRASRHPTVLTPYISRQARGSSAGNDGTTSSTRISRRRVGLRRRTAHC